MGPVVLTEVGMGLGACVMGTEVIHFTLGSMLSHKLLIKLQK